MKNLMILIFSTLAVLLTSCHGFTENGAQIILGGKSNNDTIKLPPLKHGFVVDEINVKGSGLFITYKDTINNVPVKIKYYNSHLFQKDPATYIIKFASK